MLESGVKSGSLLQLLGQPPRGRKQVDVAQLSKQVFQSAEQGDVVSLLTALQVIFSLHFGLGMIILGDAGWQLPPPRPLWFSVLAFGTVYSSEVQLCRAFLRAAA